MSHAVKFSRTKSPKNRKSGCVYTLELQMPEWMVESFCAPKWVEQMRNKHSKKFKFVLKSHNSEKGCDKKGCDEKGYKMWSLVVTGKHKQSMQNLETDVIDRYNKMIGIIQKIVKK